VIWNDVAQALLRDFRPAGYDDQEIGVALGR
jgi:hypothetical protein